MKPNSVRTKLQKAEPVFIAMSPYQDPALIEFVGHLGFDGYLIDAEHSSISPETATNLIRACEISGMTALARIGSTDPKQILQFLDSGVMGVMKPEIRTTEDVLNLIEAMKYPPLGKRGLGPVRAADYLSGSYSQEQYVMMANEEILILPQVETMECVENLEEIVKIEGVDGLILGPRDLAMSMGYYDGPNHLEVQKVINQIFDIVLNSGKILGTVVSDGNKAKEMIDRGVRFCLCSVNNLLKTASNSFFNF